MLFPITCRLLGQTDSRWDEPCPPLARSHAADTRSPVLEFPATVQQKNECYRQKCNTVSLPSGYNSQAFRHYFRVNLAYSVSQGLFRGLPPRISRSGVRARPLLPVDLNRLSLPQLGCLNSLSKPHFWCVSEPLCVPIYVHSAYATPNTGTIDAHLAFNVESVSAYAKNPLRFVTGLSASACITTWAFSILHNIIHKTYEPPSPE